MRVIVIDPIAKTVEEREATNFTDVLGGSPAQHYIAAEVIDDHICYVDENAILTHRPVWTFRGCRIWGPMIICSRLGDLDKPARCPVDEVRPYVSFEDAGQS